MSWIFLCHLEYTCDCFILGNLLKTFRRKKILRSFSMTQKETLTALSYTVGQHSLTFIWIPLLKMWTRYGCYHQEFPISPEKKSMSITFSSHSIASYSIGWPICKRDYQAEDYITERNTQSNFTKRRVGSCKSSDIKEKTVVKISS